MTIRLQRYRRTEMARWRFVALVAISDGQWHDVIPTYGHPGTIRTVASLEERGLIEVDRADHALRVRIVLPEQAWLEQLERRFERKLQEGAR